MDISFYVSMYIQDEYRRLYTYFLVLLFTVNVISHLLLRVVLFRLQVAEEFFVSFRQTACIYNYDFHSLLLIILLSQPP